MSTIVKEILNILLKYQPRYNLSTIDNIEIMWNMLSSLYYPEWASGHIDEKTMKAHIEDQKEKLLINIQHIRDTMHKHGVIDR
jgi:hypothetical protein